MTGHRKFSELREKMENKSNPKDLVGRTKAPLSLAPPVAVAHMAHAFADGAEKYGPYNWRNYPVEAMVYTDACLRHIQSWFEGEEIADDSGVHHLGHALACLAILLDAQSNDQLIDNRPKSKGSYQKLLQEINAKILYKVQKKKSGSSGQGGGGNNGGPEGFIVMENVTLPSDWNNGTLEIKIGEGGPK